MSCFNSDLKEKNNIYTIRLPRIDRFLGALPKFTAAPQICIKFESLMVSVRQSPAVGTALSVPLRRRTPIPLMCPELGPAAPAPVKAVTLVFIWTQRVNTRTQPIHSLPAHDKGSIAGNAVVVY